MEKITFTVGRGSRLLLFACLCVVGFVVASLIAYVIGADTTPRVRIAAVVQDVVGFVLPAVATAMMVTRRPADMMMIARPRSWRSAALMVAALIVFIPAMNVIVEWNASLPMPDAWRMLTEAQSATIGLLFGGDGAGSLVAAMLIIGLMAPLAEELLFRGCLQRLLSPMTGRHVAVWLAAIIFSLIHFDMSGFVPRALLGAAFGYAMIWSGSVWSAVACHVVNNIMAVTAMWLQMRGDSLGDTMQTIGEGSPLLTAVSAIAAAAMVYGAWRERAAVRPGSC